MTKGADVNSKDNYGNTPLHYAVLGGHTEIAELLIAEGADVNARRDDGMTPVDLPSGANIPNSPTSSANIN